MFCAVDVTSEEQVDAGFAKARAAHGQERILVNCAGTGNAIKTASRDKKTGEIKCSIAAPEVSFFWKELERNGDWRTRPEQEESGAMDVESVIDIANSPPAKS